MKKIILATVVASLATSAVFASTVPVTKINAGQTTVNADYAFQQRVSNKGTNNDGFGVGINTAISDKAALQYSYGKVNAKHGDIKDHRAGVTYALNNNVNVFGEGTYIKAGGHDLGAQVGLVGHTQLTDKVEGYAKAGFGNDVKQSYQLGAKYALTPDVNLNAYYGYDKYSVDNDDTTVKGLHAGVGYSF
ncbi:MAG: porin family protein [Veillonella sp.]|nr:porin family protein [Veillonella sp.]